MAEKEGWIKTYRKIQDCWIWRIDKPFDERSAWIDLLLSANHTAVKTSFNGELITVKRSQYLTSVRKLSDKWKWNKDKTLKFLRLLESDGMIKRDSDRFRTLITIENYDIYQDKKDTERTQGGTHQGTADGHDTDTTRTRNGREPATNKNVKNVKNIYSGGGDDNINIYIRTHAREMFKKYWNRKPTRKDFDRVRGLSVGRTPNGVEVIQDKVQLLEYAFDCSSRANSLNWDYVYGVINNLKARGIDNIDKAYEYELNNK